VRCDGWNSEEIYVKLGRGVDLGVLGTVLSEGGVLRIRGRSKDQGAF
jgi:hypothetical protein